MSNPFIRCFDIAVLFRSSLETHLTRNFTLIRHDSDGKLSNCECIITLPCHLLFGEGQVKLVFAVRCFRWLVLIEHAFYFTDQYRGIGNYSRITVRFIFFVCAISKCLVYIYCCFECFSVQFERLKKLYVYKIYPCYVYTLTPTDSVLIIPCPRKDIFDLHDKYLLRRHI